MFPIEQSAYLWYMAKIERRAEMGDEQETVEPGEIKRQGANVTIGAPIVVAISTSPLNTDEVTSEEQED